MTRAPQPHSLLTLAGLAALLPLAAAADAAESYACQFETSCFLTEPCTDTDWEMTLAPAADGWTMSSIAGDRRLEEMAEEEGHLAYLSRPENGAVALLTLSEDGAAIYSELSLSGGYAVTDYGRCRPAS